MKQLHDSVWQRRGTSWLWDDEARNQVCQAQEVWSLRQFLSAAGQWPSDLPSNNNLSLIVAGLESSLDLLSPEEGELWLSEMIKPALLSFQDEYGGEASLIFWMPRGQSRFQFNSTNDSVSWLCEAPHRGSYVDFGRILWGEANEYPQEILLRLGGTPAGLFHLRIT